MRTTVMLAIAAMALSTATAQAVERSRTRAIFEVLDFGETATVLRHGPLTLLAGCQRDPPETRGFDVVTLAVTSDDEPWVLTSERGFEEIPPNDPRTLLFFARQSGPAFEPPVRMTFGNDFDGSGAVALAADGTYLAVAADTLAFGVEVFATDCLIVGTATLIRGRRLD